MSVRKSLAWSYGAQAFIFIQTFAVSVIVARILGPYEMGIFAVGMSIAGALSILSSFGVGPYLVRHESPDAGVKATVFTVNGVLNVLVAAVIAGVALLGSRFGINPGVRQVLLLLAIGPLIGIFDFLPGTFMQREMNFRMISMIAMGKAVVSSLVLLSLALAGFGYLSPPLAMLGSTLFSTLVTIAVARQHFSVRIATTGWQDLTKFGMQMMSIGGLAALVQRLSELVLSRLQGIASLGIYSRASSLSNQIWDNVYGLSTRVIFSQMAKEMRETGTVHTTFLSGLSMITGLVWPIIIGIAILSQPIIHVLYGEKWSGAAAPLAMLMVSYFVLLCFGMNWELCVLRKQTGWQARMEAMRAVVGLVAFSTGAWFSIVGAALGRVVEALFALCLFGPRMRELAGTEPGQILGVYRRSAALTAAAVLPSFVLMVAEGWSPTTSWLRIAPAIVLGIVAWLATLHRLKHPLLAEILRVLAYRRRFKAG